MKFHSNNPSYEYLRKKWLQKHEFQSQKLLDKHKNSLRKIVLSGLGSIVLLTTPGLSVHAANSNFKTVNTNIIAKEDKNLILKEKLPALLPNEVQKLTPAEENNIAAFLTENFKFPVKAEIDGIRLNRSYGYIGQEQHLYRYPGDSLILHADNMLDWQVYGDAGIAPKLAAWGYFAPSKAQFDNDAKQEEKYYIAVQTFLAPGYAENVNKYRDFFKYRKMLLVNPTNGKSIIVDIADAGPAEWTGKHLGGSPEVMHFLELQDGLKKGAVLYFFIDDSGGKIPLGPIHLN